MNLNPGKFFGGFLTKLSQLTNDAGFATPASINSTVVPRYAKQHMTPAGSPDTLTITWPAGRFTDPPIMPDPTVVTADTSYVYKARVTTCDATGCTIKITRQNVNLTISLGLLSLNPPITAPVAVNVFAIQQTD